MPGISLGPRGPNQTGRFRPTLGGERITAPMSAPTVTVKQCYANFGVSVIENLLGGPAGVVPVSHWETLLKQLTFSPSGTPPVSLLIVYAATIVGGGYDIDLTAAQGTQGTVDATGLRVQLIAVDATGLLGDFTLDAGPANGYEVNGSGELHFTPGGLLLKFLNDAYQDVDATHRMLRVSGTDGDVPMLGILLG